MPLIGVGGIESGADALARIRAGASALQLYTALVYEGPAVIGRILLDLDRRLERAGHTEVKEVVGADA